MAVSLHATSMGKTSSSHPKLLLTFFYLPLYYIYIDVFRLETKQEGPSILHGRNPEELPSRQIDVSQENEEVFAAYTGPDSGLTAVNLQQKHLSISDTDIDYIDMLDQNEQYRSGEFRKKILK